MGCFRAGCFAARAIFLSILATFALNACLDVRVPAYKAQEIFNGPSTSPISFVGENIMQGDMGAVVLNIADADKVHSGVVGVYDETGAEIWRTVVRPGVSSVSVELTSKGSYSIEASISYKNGTIAKESAVFAIIGEPLPDNVNIDSSFGLWNVSADPSLAIAAGARWSRRVWTLKDYREAADGEPIPMKHVTRVPEPGLRWIGTLAWGLPQYITGVQEAEDALYPPNDWDSFARLVERFARDVPDFPPYFEIYNEPEVTWKLTDTELVRFLSTIAQGIKAIHPGTMVLGPTLYEINLERLKRLISLGLLNELDGLSVHAYVNGTSPETEFIGRVKALKEYLVKAGHPTLPLYITEFGWTTSKGTWQKPVNELTQARYLSRSMTLLSTEEIAAKVYFCLLYRTDNSGEAGFSILHQDGTPKPAYAAYANVARWLSGVGTGRWLRVSSSVNVALFKEGMDTIVVAWDVGGGSILSTGFVPREASGMTGTRAPAEQTEFTLNGSPVFLRLLDASLFDMGILEPVSIKRGGSAKIPLLDQLGNNAFTLKNGVLKVSSHASRGSYIIMGVTSAGWQALPLDVR